MKKLPFLAAVLAPLIIYIGAYFILARPAVSGVVYSRTPVVQAGQVVLSVETYPDYRGVPEKLFRPLHYLDSHYIRSNHWFAISLEAPPKWEDK